MADHSTTTIAPDALATLIEALPSQMADHVPGSAGHDRLRRVARGAVESRFADTAAKPHPLGPFGEVVFPYHRMGAVDSLDLLDIDELIVLAFYWTNRKRYRRVADLGANIGLHSLALARCGLEVRAYEPDPDTFAMLERNLRDNDARSVTPIRAAVSDKDGSAEFVRVLGNRTGSHLAGAKADPYGELERFAVEVKAFAPIAAWADLVKIDVEGHEAALIAATDATTWRGTDAIMEVGSPANARAVFDHLNGLNVSMFAQKLGWSRVRGLGDMPTSYRDGGLFVTAAYTMPWEAP
jgi:FkbM family methyltransferase